MACGRHSNCGTVATGLPVANAVKELLRSGLHFFDRRTLQVQGAQVLIIFDDIRDSTLVFSHSRARASWVVRYLTTRAPFLVQVR
jgi:hypothetical protein